MRFFADNSGWGPCDNVSIMSNTIGSAPRPVTTARASSASAATSTAQPAAPAAPAGPPDSFSNPQSQGSTRPIGPGVRPPQSPEEIKNMGDADLKKFTPEEIKGMSLDQFQRFTEAMDKEGALEGKGMMGLDPDARKAVLRKTIMKGLMEYFASQADKHTNFSAW